MEPYQGGQAAQVARAPDRKALECFAERLAQVASRLYSANSGLADLGDRAFGPRPTEALNTRDAAAPLPPTPTVPAVWEQIERIEKLASDLDNNLCRVSELA